jgi:hypothetical protein
LCFNHVEFTGEIGGEYGRPGDSGKQYGRLEKLWIESMTKQDEDRKERAVVLDESFDGPSLGAAR